MTWRAIGFAASLLTLLTLCQNTAARGEYVTPLQTASVPMTPTDWGVGSGGLVDPFLFTKFDPSLGTLLAVKLTLTTTIRNDFELFFPSTPTLTTLYVATTRTTDPSVLSNPSLVQQLTDGPTVTILGPDGITPIFGAPGTTLPVDVVSLTRPAGTYSSFLPDTDPNFIPPSNVTLSFSTTLDPSNAASLIPQFIGTGLLDMPATAVAHSSFYSSSGNGGGIVLTSASATVTLQYSFVPEPSGLILLATGAGLGLLAAGLGRRRHARPGAHPGRVGATHRSAPRGTDRWVSPTLHEPS